MSKITNVIVSLVADPTQTGIAIQSEMLAVPDKDQNGNAIGTISYACQIGVLWENVRSPMISFHGPEELQWLSVPELEENDVSEEDQNQIDIAEALQSQYPEIYNALSANIEDEEEEEEEEETENPHFT